MGASSETPYLAELGLGDRQILEVLGSRYEVLSFIGSGASAAVFKVADLASERQIKAAKLTSLFPSDQETDRADALRTEFGLASRFAHPNLVRYFDLDIMPAGRFSVTTMEFVDGTPLGVELTRRDVRLTCELMIQLLRGLQFLHESGFVHSDVKPSNVLCHVNYDAVSVKLLDYHLAFRPAQADQSKPRGTLRYMAPEVIAGGPADSRSDLYSAGVLFYEALTGSPLFSGSPREVAAQHLAAPVARVEVGGDLARVLSRFLVKSPEGRYASAVEAIAAIAAATGAEQRPETLDTMLGRVRSARLIGRDDAVAKLEELLATPPQTHGSPRILLIQGQPGLGKTRLLRKCEVRAQCFGFSTFLVTSDAGAYRMLDRLARWVGIETEEPPTGHVKMGAEAGLFAPAELALDPAGAGRYSVPAAMMARSDIITDRLMELGVRRRAVLLFDDMDRLGPEALECALFLARGAVRSEVRLCLTLSHATDLPRPLSDQLATWRREGAVVDVLLNELSVAARRTLISEMLPATTPTAVVNRLTEACGGSPEVIATTVEHLVTRGSLSVDARGNVVATDDFAASVPDSISRLGLDLVESVGSAARDAIELLAVADEEVPFAALASAVEVNREALRTLLDGGPGGAAISFRQAAGGPLCKLQHQAIGKALLKMSPPERTKVMHDRLADALEKFPNAEPDQAAIRTARHRLEGASPDSGVALTLELLEGRHPGDLQDRYFGLLGLALSHAEGQERRNLLEIAGDMNCARGAFGDGLNLLQDALQARPLPAAVRARLLRKVAMAYTGAGDYAEARFALAPVAGPGPDLAPSEMLEVALANLVLARVNLYESNFDGAVSNCETARDIGDQLGDDGLAAAALRALGEAYLANSLVEDARLAFTASLRVFRRLGETASHAEVLASLGRVAVVRQELKRAAKCLEEAFLTLRAEGHLSEAARALSNLGAVHQKLCNWEQAVDYYGQALMLYERFGYARGHSAVLVNLSQVNASRGWLELAIEEGMEALDIAPEDPQLRCHALNRIARAQYALGSLSAARDASLSAEKTAKALDLAVPLESAYRTLGEIGVLRGEITAAQEHLQLALALSRRTGSAGREAVCLARLAEAVMAGGDLASASSLAESACSTAEATGLESVTALTHAVRGKVELGRGRCHEALHYLLKAEVGFSRMHVCDESAEVSLRLGRTYAELGRLRFAALYYRAALDAVEQVARRLQDDRNRSLFLSDPRRIEIFDGIRSLRLMAAGQGRIRTPGESTT